MISKYSPVFALLAALGTAGHALAQAPKAPPAPAPEWLAICSKCPAPNVTSKSGIGTAKATAEARMTRADITGPEGLCSASDNACVMTELKKVYRASADCTAGRITPVDEKTYALAGLWDNSDIGGGRTKWKDAAGQIVGRDNASGGLGISQQWEVLCPGPVSAALVARAAAATPSPARPAAPPDQAPPPEPDACGGKPRCYDAGPFVAEIVQVNASKAKAARLWHIVSMNIRFRNKTNQPITLGYVVGTGFLIDDLGNRYVPSGAPEDAKGIGKVQARSADPQFVLAPGQTRAATFGQSRAMYGNSMVIGSKFNFDVSIAQLEIIHNGQQVRTIREHSLTFPDFGLGASAGTSDASAESITDAARKLRGMFKKKPAGR